MLAFDENDREVLEALLKRAEENGVAGVSIIEVDELRAMEPNVSPDAVAALSAPSSGICDPYGLTYGAAENAAANGVEFMFDTRVVGISRGDGIFSVEIQGGRSFAARSIVNCAESTPTRSTTW